METIGEFILLCAFSGALLGAAIALGEFGLSQFEKAKRYKAAKISVDAEFRKKRNREYHEVCGWRK